MGMFDFVRNEPVNEKNTTETIQALNRTAQNAELTGNTLMADACHAEMNRELDVLDALRNNN